MASRLQFISISLEYLQQNGWLPSGYTLFTPPWTGFRPSRIIKWSRLTWKIAYVIGKGT